MSGLLPLTKALAKDALLFGVSFIIFLSVSFTSLQSLSLAALVVGGYEAYARLKAKATPEEYFTPHTVIVTPNFDQILLDYKILKSHEEYSQLYDLWKKKEDQRLIGFTVLRLSSRGIVVFRHKDKHFLGSIDFEEPIRAVAIDGIRGTQTVYLRDPSDPAIGFAINSPKFYFRLSFGGYELGLMVPHDWWVGICQQNPNAEFSSAKVQTDHRIGETRVPIITIPHIAFDLFRIRFDDYEASKKVWIAIDETLPKFGWIRVKDQDSEIRDPWIRLKSKYFGVQYKEI